jgi:hypothetical protein
MTIRVTAALLAVGWAAGPAFGAPPSPDYQLLFEDNFDGPTLDESHWSRRTGPRTGQGFNSLNLARNVSIADGALRIVAKQEVINGKTENTGGGVISRHRFGYGYYEVRSKPFMAGRGVHSGFWQRGLAQENNAVFEIDSYELGSTHKIASNNLYVLVAPKGRAELPWPLRAQVPLTLPPDGWWVDGYEYTPAGVVFYDQGRVVARADFPDLVGAQNVWLTALNGAGRVDVDKLPGETLFDYFRYYAKDYPGVNLLPNGGFDYNLDKVDLQKPIAWTEEGDVAASRIVPVDRARGAYKLRHGGPAAYQVATRQTLEYIPDGDYRLTARVRRNGGHTLARLRVTGFGGDDLVADIPATDQWKEIEIARVAVANHRATIAIESAGAAGDWMEVDQVQFMKPPPPGRPPRRPARPIGLMREGEPIWQIAQRQPIDFIGNEKFYYFSRDSGLGGAITVTFVMQPRRRQNTVVLLRMPQTGENGWAVGLTAGGDVVFRVGSQARHHDVVAAGAYRAGAAARVTCVLDRGTARIYVDGVLKQTAKGLDVTTIDATAAGRLGANGGVYAAVREAAVPAGGPPAPRQRFDNYDGTLGDVRIYNCALNADQIAKLGPPPPRPPPRPPK